VNPIACHVARSASASATDVALRMYHIKVAA
jgi:hypothetical protein